MYINLEDVNIQAAYVLFGAGQYLKEHARGDAGECCLFPPSKSSIHYYWLLVVVLSPIVWVASSTICTCIEGHILGTNSPSPEMMSSECMA